MKIERFTDKAREAVSEAAELAKQHNNSQIEVEHLLAALLSQEGGVVPQVIQESAGRCMEGNEPVPGRISQRRAPVAGNI